MSAGQIGMLVGARSLLAVLLSIHVGALMDRLGTRRVALFFVWTAMALAPVFPLLPWFWPLLLLQVVNGGALQFAWSGSQTLIANWPKARSAPTTHGNRQMTAPRRPVMGIDRDNRLRQG
jgi:MFS family permease